MVEYGVLLSEMALGSIRSLTGSAQVWLSRINWELLGYAALGLIALRMATWAFRSR